MSLFENWITHANGLTKPACYVSKKVITLGEYCQSGGLIFFLNALSFHRRAGCAHINVRDWNLIIVRAYILITREVEQFNLQSQHVSVMTCSDACKTSSDTKV